MTTNTATWLDIIPSIHAGPDTPDGVVLISRDDETHAITCEPYHKPDTFAMILDGPAQGKPVSREHVNGWAVDLEHPQGFAYALRYLLSHPDRHLLNTARHEILRGQLAIVRWAEGKTTDADRLALARAIAAVVS